MKSRRDEIEEKKARIADLKRQREEKRLRQSGVGLGGSVSPITSYNTKLT